MAKTPARPTVIPKAHEPVREVDIDLLLSADEQKVIREKARAKIQARDKLDAEEALLKREMDKLDRDAHPEVFEEMREIRFDPALYVDRAILDGKQYFANELYTVPKRVYDVLKEMERNSHRHDAEIHNGSTSDAFYRKERNTRLNWQTGAVTNAPARF